MRFADGIKSFINPIITKKKDYKIAVETCESLPGKEILISRPNDLTLVYYNDNFKYEDNKLTGMAARLFDQAYQFLDGINPTALGLISDAQEDGSLYDLNEEELKELVEVYKKYIEVKSASLKSSIDSNESLQKEYKQLQFMESVINGKTQVVESDAEVEQRQRAQKVANASMAQKAKIDKQVKKADYINYVRKTSKKRRRSK